MKQHILGARGVALVGILFIGITLLANTLLRGAQIDLTSNRLYTVSEGTAHIVRGLKEPVNLYLFFSERTATQLPDIKNYGVRVHDFLEELAALSNGKLTLKVIDPQAFSEEEDRATELGAAAFITKPFRIFELSQRMRATLRKRTRDDDPVNELQFHFLATISQP